MVSSASQPSGHVVGKSIGAFECFRLASASANDLASTLVRSFLARNLKMKPCSGLNLAFRARKICADIGSSTGRNTGSQGEGKERRWLEASVVRCVRPHSSSRFDSIPIRVDDVVARAASVQQNDFALAEPAVCLQEESTIGAPAGDLLAGKP